MGAHSTRSQGKSSTRMPPPSFVFWVQVIGPFVPLALLAISLLDIPWRDGLLAMLAPGFFDLDALLAQTACAVDTCGNYGTS